MLKMPLLIIFHIMIHLGFFTVSAPRPIQSISRNVPEEAKMLYRIMYLKKVLLLQFTKALGKNDPEQKDSVHKSNEIEVIALQTIQLCIVGELAGGESVCMAIGISDI